MFETGILRCGGFRRLPGVVGVGTGVTAEDRDAVINLNSTRHHRPFTLPLKRAALNPQSAVGR